MGRILKVYETSGSLSDHLFHVQYTGKHMTYSDFRDIPKTVRDCLSGETKTVKSPTGYNVTEYFLRKPQA